MEQNLLEQFFRWYDTAEYAADYTARCEALRGLFSGYQSATGKDKEFMNRLLTAHACYSRQCSKSGMQRKHNTFILRYVAGISEREIGRNLNVSVRTVFRDISDVIENMMVLAFGVYGLHPQEKPLTAD